MTIDTTDKRCLCLSEMLAGEDLGDDVYITAPAKREQTFDFLGDKVFQIKNNLLTSEGVLALLIMNLGISIYEGNFLILGGGSLGTSIGVLFNKLGLKFGIFNVGEERYYQAYHLTPNCFSELPDLGEYDAIINTIPAKILDTVPKGILLIEAASVNCIEPSDEFRHLPAPALPGKYMPKSAAKLMYEVIQRRKKK